MEARDGMSSAVTVIGAEAPSAYHVAPRNENAGQISGSLGVVTSPVSVGLTSTTEKKKRGRPRKYGPDGSMALSPTPISSSFPPSGDFSSGKRGRGRVSGYENKHHKKMGMDNLGKESFQIVSLVQFVAYCFAFGML